ARGRGCDTGLDLAVAVGETCHGKAQGQYRQSERKQSHSLHLISLRLNLGIVIRCSELEQKVILLSDNRGLSYVRLLEKTNTSLASCTQRGVIMGLFIRLVSLI